ncbi:thiamine-monophosphate kinase [Candidatus Nitrosoglobus terrae]|uniref:Thiamine-monophosphate kinase n=1 Tax=Candidatus Nitrosoglobus terrae TaxID=1630141 RepID=A0A1Q2SLV0_9GAMM|nr:thiamine-phosphate kinase [Candidatus Nitrosoglobus terrae]BAW80077.1 thiamine-monophosphate kinase [Candidatus Nitrosoglobus terrae]
MTIDEFSLINEFFTNCTHKRDDVSLAIGDDCALATVPLGYELAISIDTLIEGIHFTAAINPAALGHKALAVGLSDLAAMGATPAWATLALTLPRVDRIWLAQFTQGLSELAVNHGVQLIGGDTTRGSLAVTMQLHGFVPKGKALRRDKACVGDGIYVTGTLGDAGLALQARLKGRELMPENLFYAENRLDWPRPRVPEAQAIRSLAHAAIDISDGLAADLRHILNRSGVGAVIEMESLPLSQPLQSSLERIEALTLALTAGDDYELCITAPLQAYQQMQVLLSNFGCSLTFIGVITEGSDLRCCLKDGTIFTPQYEGYRHF